MKNLEILINKFRFAIDIAKAKGLFSEDCAFSQFPRGCCGDASDLLAQYLLNNGVRTWYICGMHYPLDGTEDERWERRQSHAWLTTNDPRLTDRIQIIDITGDQFRDDPEYDRFDRSVYFGPMDSFHKLFEVDKSDIHEFTGLNYLGDTAASRLWNLYHIIVDNHINE